MKIKHISLELNLSEAEQLFEILDNIVCGDYEIKNSRSVRSDNAEFAQKIMDTLYSL